MRVELDSSVLDNMHSQVASDSAKRSQEAASLQDDNRERESLIFIRNVFLKYLETLYSLKTGKK